MSLANFPGPDSSTFRTVKTELADLYGIDISYEQFEELSVRMSNANKNFFHVRFLESRGGNDGLWAVRFRRETTGTEDPHFFIPVVRNKHSKAICQVLPLDALEDHADFLRILTPASQAHFNEIRLRLIEEGTFSFFTLEDFSQICRTVRQGKGRMIGESADGRPLYEVGLLRKGHTTPRAIAVEVDIDLEIAVNAWGMLESVPVKTSGVSPAEPLSELTRDMAAEAA